MKFKINEGSLLEKVLLFNNDIEIHKITPLLGGNSVGKTTLLKSIAYSSIKPKKVIFRVDKNLEYMYSVTPECDKSIKTLFIASSNMNYKVGDNLNRAMNTSSDGTGLFALSESMNMKTLSEGQGVFRSINFVIEDIGKYAKYEKDKIYLLLLDEFDSGLSLNHVATLCRKLKNLSKSIDNLYIILSFNNYEAIPIFKEVFDMYTGEWRNDIKTYEQYAKYIKSNSKLLESKRKRNVYNLRANEVFQNDFNEVRERNYNKAKEEIKILYGKDSDLDDLDL